jgi:hypothetical protein
LRSALVPGNFIAGEFLHQLHARRASRTPLLKTATTFYIAAVAAYQQSADGWNIILSSLKTYLEQEAT